MTKGDGISQDDGEVRFQDKGGIVLRQKKVNDLA